MAYQAPRKKKEWWETALDWVGQTADKIIPGDQSSWHSGGDNKPTPQVQSINRPQIRVAEPQVQPTLQVRNSPIGFNNDDPLELAKPITQKIELAQPQFDEKAVDERLDKGYSWEQIAKETNTDVNKVKEYSQKTRPNYGIAPKDVKPKHEFYDYRMEKVGNKKILGMDVGQFMGDYGDVNKMHVDKTVNMTKDDLVKGFDFISRENAKYNTGKQTRDLYVNKLRDMAENGDERAKFTLKTLKDAGKLEGDWTDFLDSANKKFYGGLQQSGARAIEYLPGNQGTGEWADRQKELNRAAVERGKQGEVAGQVMRTGLDIGTMITPVGMVDKAVKGTRAVQGLTNMNRGAGFLARTLPGSAVATGMDIASQDLQGNDQNIAKSVALGTAIDLGLPVAGKVVSKIPGVDQAGKFVMDQAGNLVRQTGNVVEAGKNNVKEVRNTVRNSLDDVIDSMNERWVANNPGSGFVPSRVARETRKGNTVKINQAPQTTNLTPNTPRSDVKPFNPVLQPETKAGIDDLIARSEATPVPEGMQRVFQSNSANGGKTNWVFDDVDSLTAYKNNTTNAGDTFEFIDVPKGSLKPTGNGKHVFTIAEAPAPKAPETAPKIPSYVPEDRVDDYLKSADYQRDLEFERMASQTKSGDPFDHPEMYDNPTPEMYDNLKAPVDEPEPMTEWVDEYNGFNPTQERVTFDGKDWNVADSVKVGNDTKYLLRDNKGRELWTNQEGIDSARSTPITRQAGLFEDNTPAPKVDDTNLPKNATGNDPDVTVEPGYFNLRNPDGSVSHIKYDEATPQQLYLHERSRKVNDIQAFQNERQRLLDEWNLNPNSGQVKSLDSMIARAQDELDSIDKAGANLLEQAPAPKAEAPAPRTDRRAIDADAQMERLRQRAANPLPPQNIAEAYGLKPDTVERLVRDYGVDKARSIIQRSSDASNIRNMDAFVISQAQKAFGKVNPPAGKIRVKNGEEVVDTPPIEAYDTPNTVNIADTTDAEERLIANNLAEEQRVQDYRDRSSYLTEQQERQLAEANTPPVNVPPTEPPIRAPIERATDLPDSELGRMAETFYDSKQGNQKIRFADIENLGKQITREIDDQFKMINSDFPTVARTVEEARRNGAKSLDEVNLTNAEKDLWRKAEAEMDYVRRRASLGRKEVSEGDFGEMYFPNQAKDAYPTRDSLFEGFRDVKPGNEFTRQGKLKLDEMSFDPDVVGGYVTRYADTKLLQEERIYRAMAKNNPDLPEEQVRKAAQEVINIQNDVNKLATKVKLTGKKVTVSDGKVIDTADRMRQVGEQLGKEQHVVTGTPRGLTNGDRINSVDIQYKGEVHTVGDFLGLNQYRDSLPFTGTQLKRAGGDRDALADMVAERLNSAYRLPAEDVDYLVESVRRMKAGLPEEVVMARVNSVYRNAAKSQLMEQLQHINIQNKTLRNDVSRLANQILREGTIQQELSAKITQNTLRTTNALFRKLNVSSAINELSDLTSFVTVYGKNTKLATPDFKLVKEMGVGELDPALEPFLRQVESGADPKTLLKKMAKVGGKINEGTRFYKAVETYKAAVFLKTARDFYSSKAGGNLAGDELTAKVLNDYRQLALPVDAFTKTFLDDFPLFTQYMTWGARNLQKEGRLLTGQIDAGLMKDKSTMERIARDVYANIPAKTAFWLASNGLKGTTIMTAFGLTDFTGLTNQDYSGIAEEDKSWFDKTTEFTNISTIMSLINTTVQSLEKEHLKEKYKDADYNPYEHANFGDSLLNTYTPQFWKNASGAQELQEKGYSEAKSGRVQYEAPEDAWNTFKSFVFGKNQTENAREYSGRENLGDRMQEGQNPFTAMRDMAAEQLGLKDTDYNRPLTDDYSEAYKAAEEGANTALLEGGRKYNDYLDDLKKNSPDLYNNYIAAMDGNHVSPEYWRNIAGGPEGGNNLETFKMIKNRKQQLQKDLGVAYDPLYGDELNDEQVAAVLRYKSAPTGDDLAVRNTLNKEQWYKDLKARQKAFYDANPKEEGEAGFKETQRVKEWNALDDQLSSFYYDAEEIKKNGAPAWAEKFPTVFQQKAINDQYGFESEESKNFFRAYGDQYRAEKEAYDKTQLDIINRMRKIEGYPEMSWEAYQQATEIADTDGDSSSKSGWKNYSKGGGGGSSISPNADVTYNSAGTLRINKPTVKAPTVKIKRKGDVKKITFKRSKRG